MEVKWVEERLQHLHAEGNDRAVTPHVPNEDAEDTVRLEAPEYFEGDLAHLPHIPVGIANRRKICWVPPSVSDDVQVGRMSANQLDGAGGNLLPLPPAPAEQPQDTAPD